VSLGGAELARADEGPRTEVAPGIHLASASELAEPGGDPQPSQARRSGPTPMVVGGNPTTIARWPWQVSIGWLVVHPTDALRNHNCGGTLVAPRIVVSAAHCMTVGGEDFKPPEEFQVVSGRTRLSSDAGQLHEVADYFWFVDEDGAPLWNPETVEWDVVFILLASSASQETIKIAGPGEEPVWAPGRRAFVTGWGSTVGGTDFEAGENIEISDVLRAARIRMISDSACDSVYGPVLFPAVMVCAGERAGGVDVCYGDSGGPLVVPIAGGGYRLIGNTSFADGCGLPDTPGVYGRLAADPIRGALREGIRAVAGIDVVGSGAEPSNQFRFGPRSRNPGRGTARLTVRVPGRGKVSLHASGRVRGAAVYPSEAGPARVLVRPRGNAKRRLDRTGRARVRARVTYEPTGGEPRTKSTRVRLVERR
jgi:hypothetical protein